MKVKKSVLKGSLFLSICFLLAACDNNKENLPIDTNQNLSSETINRTTTAIEIKGTATKKTTTDETTKGVGSEESSTKENQSTTLLEASGKDKSSNAKLSESFSKEQNSRVNLPTLNKTIDLKEGKYIAVSKENEQGWSLEHTIIVKDGKVTESKFDYVNAKNEKLTKKDEFNLQMQMATGANLAEAIDSLNKNFLEDPFAVVDVVTGATQTSEDFKLSAYTLVKAAQEGNQEKQEIELEDLSNSLRRDKAKRLKMEIIKETKSERRTNNKDTN